MGKTLIAKVTANELRIRDAEAGRELGLWMEIFPESFADLDKLMRLAQAHPGTVLFFDEIHGLEEREALRLYELLANGRFQFHGETQATLLPPTQVLAATTDYGSLHSALKRRFVNHDFRPATPEQLKAILTRRATLPIEPKALDLIVSRTHFSGAPWEGLEILRLTGDAARSRGSRKIELQDVQRIFRLEEIDERGLRYIDRRVIEALLTQPKERRLRGGGTEFVCYGASEQNLCMLAQIDKEEYREAVRPRLMARNLLRLMPYYGQALTEEAVRTYRH